MNWGVAMNAVVLACYVVATIVFAFKGQWPLALMNGGSVVFTSGLLWAALRLT
jgi:uncharacterized membrane protein